jgi:uncharacterized protein YndB with AHSA1/START domain
MLVLPRAWVWVFRNALRYDTATQGDKLNRRCHMAVQIHSTTVIARPAEEVFSYFLDPQKSAPLMDPTIKSVKKTPEGPIAVGTAFRMRQPVAGRMRETVLTLTGIEPARKIDFDALLGPASTRMNITFDPVEQGTKVTVAGGGKANGIFKLLSGRVQRLGQQTWDERLARIKTALESQRP